MRPPGNDTVKRIPIGATLNQAAYNLPAIEKRDKGGEDAFISNGSLMVVADGVGSWILLGVDTGLFSKHLVKNIEQEYHADSSQSLKQILTNSLNQTTEVGSSTCIIAALEYLNDTKQVTLRTLNLGDSGLIVFRESSVIGQ